LSATFSAKENFFKDEADINNSDVYGPATFPLGRPGPGPDPVGPIEREENALAHYNLAHWH
jgi:hypothetical protein